MHSYEVMETETMETETNNYCSSGCGVRLVKVTEWRGYSKEKRAQLRASGVDFHDARGMCHACYQRGMYHKNGRKGVGARSKETQERQAYYLEEYDWLRTPTRTRQQNCRAIAPRLGISWYWLEDLLRRRDHERVAA